MERMNRKSEEIKEKQISEVMASIENRVRHAYNQGYEQGLIASKQEPCEEITREEAIKMLYGMKADNLNLADLYTKNKYDALEMAIEALEQEPCEDCIGRAEAIKALNCEISGSIESDINLSKYKREFQEFANMILNAQEKAIQALPLVTPQPKTGHWIGRKKVGFGEWEDVTVLVNLEGCVTDSVECSECGNWLTGSDEYECDATYCPNCGAKMEGTE